MQWFKRFIREEDGQGLAEYGLAMVLLSIVAVFALGRVGDSAFELLSSANSTLAGATS